MVASTPLLFMTSYDIKRFDWSFTQPPVSLALSLVQPDSHQDTQNHDKYVSPVVYVCGCVAYRWMHMWKKILDDILGLLCVLLCVWVCSSFWTAEGGGGIEVEVTDV